jgi:predicted ArsR family transcriptional regulator
MKAEKSSDDKELPIYDIAINKRAANYAERMKHLEPTNAFSISQATGIPRETVRRKIDKLQQKGWAVKNERSEVYMSETVSVYLDRFKNLLRLR